MENKIYYGEYSLKHWIDLILSKNIELPPYQRIFVWGKNELQNLMKSFEEKLYVPPVTIGAYFEDEKLHNLIIDGQQRLTSIFLTYLGLFPDSTKIQNKIEVIQGNDDEEIEDEDLKNLLEWKFNRLLDFGSSKEEILSKKNDIYLSLDLQRDNSFFENNYLGFSYIVPMDRTPDTTKEQQKYYSSVFRSINKQGIPLQKVEIRESLYFFNKDYEPLFKTEKSALYTIQKKRKMDFVRYLALSSQYAVCKNSYALTKGYKTRLEDYYSAFIEYIAENKNCDINFKKIPSEAVNIVNDIFSTIEKLNFPKNFDSIINMDVYFFGIIYYMLFENKEIDTSKGADIIKSLDDEIDRIKKIDNHIKSPNAYKYLKIRIDSSLNIWGNYVHK